MITPNALQIHIDDAGIRHFDAPEFLSGSMPPNLLANALAVLELADMVRRYVDEPLILTSGYRSKEVNRAVGGSSSSSHVYAAAVDLRVAKAHLRPAANLKLRLVGALVWIAYPNIVQGFGCYAQNIHLDVPLPIKPRRWWTSTRHPRPSTAVLRGTWMRELIDCTTPEEARAKLDSGSF